MLPPCCSLTIPSLQPDLLAVHLCSQLKALLGHTFFVVLFSVGGPGQSGLDGVELDSELKHDLFLSGSLQGAGDLFTLIKSGFPSLVPASVTCGCSMRANRTKTVPCPNPSATNPASAGPGLDPHLHFRQLLLHQPLQRLLLLRFKMIPTHVNQKFLSHDGVSN